MTGDQASRACTCRPGRRRPATRWAGAFEGESVEVDVIPPNTLRGIVRLVGANPYGGTCPCGGSRRCGRTCEPFLYVDGWQSASGTKLEGGMELDLAGTLAELAEDRPIFHSEPDFQHALAWQFHLRHPQAKVRLETCPLPHFRLDLLIWLGERRTAIELKYPRTGFSGTVAGELYALTNQAAQDIHRHDVVKDVTRVETLLTAGYADEGYVVTLTNDRNYWLPSARTDTNGEAFRIHEGRLLEGTLTWASQAGPGTTKHRDAPLMLAGQYVCRWRDYSSVRGDSGKLVQLRYLLFAVNT